MDTRHADRMRDLSYRCLVLWFRICDFLSGKKDRLATFGIREGDIVVDYGCGPGRYLEEASRRVGPHGMVYAVDIHRLAIRDVGRLVRSRGLTNVVPLPAMGYSLELTDATADLIYALDMFHMVSNPKAFLTELRRIAKPGAVLILEDGHQSRKKTKEKIALCPGWRIERETAEHARLIAV